MVITAANCTSSLIKSALPLFLTLMIVITLFPFQRLNPAYCQSEDSQAEASRLAINKGNYYLTHNLFAQAIAEYEKSLELDPQNHYARGNLVLAHNNWGIFYFNQGKYDLAKQEWQTALRLSPNDRNARNNLATWQQAMVRMGKPADLQSDESRPTSEVKENPPASAVVILSPNKANARQSANKTDQGTSEASIIDQQKASAQGPNKSTNDAPRTESQAGSSESIVDRYYESGSESGAKLLSPMPSHILDKKLDTTPNVDESIARIETKIYGSAQAGSPILKRLEHIEIDSFGKKNDGPITDRLKKLESLFSTSK